MTEPKVFEWLVRSIAGARSAEISPLAWARSRKETPQSILRILEKAVGAGTVGDLGSEIQSASVAFVEREHHVGAFLGIWKDDGFLKVSLQTRVGIYAEPAGYIVGESKPAPLTTVSLVNQYLQPIDAAALIAITQEVINNADASSQSTLSKVLAEPLGQAIDAKFFTSIASSGVAQLSSAGDTEDDILLDLRRLLLAVSGGSAARYYFIVGTNVAKRAATFPRILPTMSPFGGDMVGVSTMVSAGLDPDAVALVDATAIPAAFDGVSLRASSNADLEMRIDPAQNAGAGTAGSNLVSMFQTNSIALMSVARFGCECLRDDAVAFLNDVNWGGDIEEVTA